MDFDVGLDAVVLICFVLLVYRLGDTGLRRDFGLGFSELLADGADSAGGPNFLSDQNFKTYW